MAYDLLLTNPAYLSSTYGFGLSGGSARLSASPLPTNGTFTVKCYFSTTDTGVNIAVGQAHVFWLGVISGKVAARYGGEGNEVALNTTVNGSDNAGHWVELTLGPSGALLFVDGVQAASNNTPINSTSPDYTTALEIRTFVSSFNWAGFVDEVSISSVQEHTANFTPAVASNSDTNLVALWHLQQNGTNTAVATATPGGGSGGGNYGPGRFGQALIASFVRAPNYYLPQNGNFTIRAVVSSTATVQRVAVGQAYAFWMGHDASGNATARYGNGVGVEEVVTTTAKINDGSFHELELNLGANGSKFFVDGTLVYTSSHTFFDRGGQLANPFEVRTFLNGQTGWDGAVDEVAIYQLPQHSASYTPATSPISASEANLVGVFHFDNDMVFTTGPAAPVDYTGGAIKWLPTNEAIVYSGSWHVTDARAKTINPGQYLRTLMPTGTCAVNFDLTGITTPLPQVTAYVNGVRVWRQEIAATLPIPLDIANSTQNYLLVEVFVAAMTEAQPLNRWNPQQAAVQFTGWSASSNNPLRKPGIRPRKVRIYGDSITEGVRTLSATAGSGKDTDRNDALLGWAMAMRDYLGAELDIVGFGGTGLLNPGSGYVPRLGLSYNYLWDGQPRDFSAFAADLTILMEGTNDGSSDITSAYTQVLNGLLSASPNTKILALQPFVGTQGTNIQNAVAACSTPARVKYQSTAGFWQSSDASDSLHPYGSADQGLIAPQVAAAAQSLLVGSVVPTIPTGQLPVGKSLFKFVAPSADNIANYPGLQIIWQLADGGEWASGKPIGPSFQAVKQFVPGNKYYVQNTSGAAIPLYGAQL